MNPPLFHRSAEFFFFGEDSALRRRWRKNTAGRQNKWRSVHATAEQIPECSELRIQLGFLMYYLVYLTICILSSNLHKIPFETDVPECNYCVSR